VVADKTEGGQGLQKGLGHYIQRPRCFTVCNEEPPSLLLDPMDVWAQHPDLNGPHKNGCQHAFPGSKAIFIDNITLHVLKFSVNAGKPGGSNLCPDLECCEFQMR
jgi:hypothetical protein